MTHDMPHKFHSAKFGWKDDNNDTLLYYGVDQDHPIEVPLYVDPDGSRRPAGHILGAPLAGEKESAFRLMGGENGLLEAALEYAQALTRK
jgi:hypothetical protein